MIQFIIIRRILLSLAPIFLFYLLRKMGKERQPKKKSQLSDVDPSTGLRTSKSQIVEGEIIEESNSNRRHSLWCW